MADKALLNGDAIAAERPIRAEGASGSVARAGRLNGAAKNKANAIQEIGLTLPRGNLPEVSTVQINVRIFPSSQIIPASAATAVTKATTTIPRGSADEAENQRHRPCLPRER